MFVERGEANARHILTSHKDELHNLAKGLLEHETLNREEIREVLAGRPIRRAGEAKAGAGKRGAEKAGEKAVSKGGLLPATHATRQ